MEELRAEPKGHRDRLIVSAPANKSATLTTAQIFQYETEQWPKGNLDGASTHSTGALELHVVPLSGETDSSPGPAWAIASMSTRKHLLRPMYVQLQRES